MSEFTDALQGQLRANQAHAHEVRLGEDLQVLLSRISGSPEGTQPADFMPDGMTDMCDEFLDAAEQMDWPNAEDLELRTRRTGRVLWESPSHHERKAKGALFTAIETRQVDSWKGYHIADLRMEGMAIRPRVFLCDDGLLRVERTPRVFMHSYGVGVGKMPQNQRGLCVELMSIKPPHTLAGAGNKAFAGVLASKLKK